MGEGGKFVRSVLRLGNRSGRSWDRVLAVREREKKFSPPFSSLLLTSYSSASFLFFTFIQMFGLTSAVRASRALPLIRIAPFSTTRSILEEAALNRAERLKSRFWKTVTLEPPSGTTSGFQILLDGKSIRTPSGRPIVIPADRELLATCIAQEWSEQGRLLKPHTLPLTSLAARALEGCSDEADRRQIERDLLKYLEGETVCFQESNPQSLVDLQTIHWDPLIKYINSTYNTHITPFTNLLGNSHPPQHPPHLRLPPRHPPPLRPRRLRTRHPPHQILPHQPRPHRRPPRRRTRSPGGRGRGAEPDQSLGQRRG